MLAFPNIKINLGLYITEKRNDGYHNLLTCFYPVPWHDVLEIVPQKEFEFVQTGLKVPGNSLDNLCVKAYELLKREHGLPNARIHLHKIVPMGAGLGGGSSDGAFALKVLNSVFELHLDTNRLEEYAAQLGSDCAFFIRNSACIATGRGEVMHEVNLDLKGQHIVIVCPPLHVSTADAFGQVQPRFFEGDFKELLQSRKDWKSGLKNQFEETVFPKHPLLANIKQELYEMGAWYAAMSGSGSAVFGLFENSPPKYNTLHTSFQTVL
jgi:4-diphosphocytidyl-2-C-methyl-D-erythritol kinase